MRSTTALGPLLDQDIIVEKHRIGASTGSDLEMIRRAGRIRRLVRSGCATSGVVLTIVREAADKDFQLPVLADGCADADAEIQRMLLPNVFPVEADVIPVAKWLAAHQR